MITTDIIKTTQAAYARAALTRLAGRWWWVAAVPVAGFAVASLWDVSYLFAALIWLLMLLPPAIMIAYYSYLLKPAAAAMSRPHRVTFGPGKEVTVKFESGGDEDVPAHDDIYLPASCLCDCDDRADSLQLDYKESELDILIVPYSSLTPTDLVAVTNIFLPDP